MSRARDESGGDLHRGSQTGRAATGRLSELIHEVQTLHEELNTGLSRLRSSVSSSRLANRRWGAAESGPLGYVTLDGDGKILDCNLTLCDMLGRGRSRITGSDLRGYVSPGDHPKLESHLSRCREAASGGYVSTEIRLGSATEAFPVRLLSNQSREDDGELLFRTAVLDRTEEIAMQHALRASERRLAAAVDASGAGVLEHEVPFEGIVYVSESWAKILGYRTQEIPHGNEFLEWLGGRCHPEDRPRLEAIYDDVVAGIERYETEARLRHRNGEWIWVKIWGQVSPRTSSGVGAGRRVVGVMMDVTGERRKTREVERRAQQLRRLATELHSVEERERRQIASDLHDELAQLLVATSMKLAALEVAAKSEAVRDGIGDAAKLLERADQFIRSLILQVSPPVLEELGLVPALEWLVDDLKHQFGLDVEIDSEEPIPQVTPSVRFMLYRAVRELLINVAKHAETDRARVEVGPSDAWEVIRVTVSDEGRGFEPGEAREEIEGGFGLFSLEERLDSMGGALEIETAPGAGTRVRLQVPTGYGGDEDPAREVATIGWPGHLETPSRAEHDRLRILVVDDHDLVRLALAQMLTAQPEIDVIGEASDGESAVVLCERLEPDLVLMDVTMPGMGGIEATRRLTAEHPDLRVIGLSMHESEEVAKAMRTAGAAAYVQKNDSAEGLLRVIHDVASEGASR